MDAEERDAREAIRDLVARYHQCGDAGRIDALIALFAGDAVLEAGGRSYRGVAAIRAMFDAAARATRDDGAARLVRHFTASHAIDWLGDGRAHGRAYFLVLSELGLDHWGRYADEYALEGGGWRFARRRVSVDGRTPGGWAERVAKRLGHEL